MRTIKFKKAYRFNGVTYEPEDEMENAEKVKFEDILKLNEKGYIYPLSQKELRAIKEGSFFNVMEEEE